nr:hypothetical protein B0A51_01522 [Rachicladosporium sp. CCFEE 5018]
MVDEHLFRQVETFVDRIARLTREGGGKVKWKYPKRGLKMRSDSDSDDDRATPATDTASNDITMAMVKGPLVAVNSAEIGMTADSKVLYSGPEDKKGRFQWKDQPPKDLEKPAEDAESLKHAILVRYVKTFADPRRNLRLHSVVVQSPLLREILGDVLKGYPGLSTELTRLEFSGNFEPLIHRWEQFTAAIEDLKVQAAALETPDTPQEEVTTNLAKLAVTTDTSIEANGKEAETIQVAPPTADVRLKHALLLYNLLATELKDTIETSSDMIKKGHISFDLMWTAFQPGSLVYAKVMQRDRVFRLQSSAYGHDQTGDPVFHLTMKFIDFDGTRHGTKKQIIPIAYFEGTKPFTSLSALPLASHPQQQVIKNRLTVRGAKVEALAGVQYRGYDGTGYFINQNNEIEYVTVRGRVVIDALSWNKWVPNHAVYLTPLHAKETVMVNGFNATAGDDDEHDEYEEEDDYQELDDDMNYAPPMEDQEDKKRPTLSPEQQMLCTPVVRGYALKEKLWLNMFVNATRDVTFSTAAFESLVLPDGQKDMLLGFTAMQMSAYTQWDDVVSGKGKGILLLLSGPPGVGKTLTAESVAEEMKVPLYSVTAGDLGWDRNIEKKLVDIFTMVTRWNAILLIDEADVFMEARSLEAIERNKLVSIFLRVLEYFEGIAFLTTNRVQTFDPAFQSRIHISIDYPELSAESRKTVWKTFLASHDVVQATARDKLPVFTHTKPSDDASDRANSDYEKAKADYDKAIELHPKRTLPHELSENDIHALSLKALNGRQIKNLLKTAQLHAIYKGEALSKKHIDHSLGVTQHLLQSSQQTAGTRASLYG